MNRSLLRLAALTLTWIAVGRAEADIVYDNGPINGSFDAFLISSGFEVSDSFTLAGATTLTGAQHVGLWVPSGDTPLTVEWSLGTTASGSDLGSGTSALSATFHSAGVTFTVFDASFSLSGTLAAGTYYLTLQDATPAGGVYWDVNNGPSQAFLNGSHVGSESFQLVGTPVTAVPEPSTWAPCGIACVAGLIALRRRK